MCFSLSAANSINFRGNIIRAARGAPEISKTNCGLKPTPTPVEASKLDLEWVNKGTSVAILTGTISSTLFTNRSEFYVGSGLSGSCAHA